MGGTPHGSPTRPRHPADTQPEHGKAGEGVGRMGWGFLKSLRSTHSLRVMDPSPVMDTSSRAGGLTALECQ